MSSRCWARATCRTASGRARSTRTRCRRTSLLRVAAGLIADDVAATAGEPAPERSLLDRARAVRRPWVRSFVVVGSQWRAEYVRDGLVAQGHKPGGRRPTAYLLADDLATVLAEAWTARAFDQGGPGWTDFLRNSARLRPPAAARGPAADGPLRHPQVRRRQGHRRPRPRGAGGRVGHPRS
ncbi:hypothetical protein G5V59_18330 [Nocardioides sp. W3-2-3]|uniref:hypothetical protein n=1 Tax=Nocardioides convexus TaxID=2712224 RepID=UPI0024182261|nr:hypothetical protein [Nocardioides convexus]NHA01155.1 hypothetical protein [Nocardioides convexus]